MAQIIEVRSKSRRDVVYRVDPVGRRCSCPAWVFKMPRQDCKHLKALAAGKKMNGQRVVELDDATVAKIWPIKAPKLDL